jgi:hypothetical protein
MLIIALPDNPLEEFNSPSKPKPKPKHQHSAGIMKLAASAMAGF